MSILVTGGAGFIGSNFILHRFSQVGDHVVNLDKLTYAGNLRNLEGVKKDPRYTFVKGDIRDYHLLVNLMQHHQVRIVVNFAAESHVDRSIHGPEDFIQTNVVGTFHLLEATRIYWESLTQSAQEAFRILHVSTDEVYGSLTRNDPPFREDNNYQPNSPYSASKASSDHLMRAYHHTYGLPTIITNCSNNYGPFQFPEKLIPLCIHNALAGKPLPIYGDGQQVRDWIYVGDHCRAINKVLEIGQPGQTYNIGGNAEKTNLEVVHTLCDILDQEKPHPNGTGYREQITFVRDRAGHDRRYAIDNGKISREIGWQPTKSFSKGLRKTVHWYLNNKAWVAQVTSGAYHEWMQQHYDS